MDEQIRQIGERIRGLRDALDLSVEDMAGQCGLPVEQYKQIESGECDIAVSTLQQIGRKCNVPLDVLMFGEEPKMNAYFLTRWGTGISVERTKAYKYQSLASGFRNRKADPFLVTVEPKPEDTPIYYNTHYGQEFNLVIEGRMLLRHKRKRSDSGAGRQFVFRFFTASRNEGARRESGEVPRHRYVVINFEKKYVRKIC